MIRRFNFEDEVHHSLACVPMAVRRKLDRVGVKVSLEQWQTLAQHERLAICHLPTDSDEERETVRTYLEETVKARAGTATGGLHAIVGTLEQTALALVFVVPLGLQKVASNRYHGANGAPCDGRFPCPGFSASSFLP